jgi:hypothetical protein
MVRTIRPENLARGLAVLASTMLTACSAGPVPDDLDTERLCHIVASAPVGDPAVLSEVARQFRVEQRRLRCDENGIYVPRSTFFVEELGIFLARPGVVPPTASDPSFTPVSQCVYRYRVAG